MSELVNHKLSDEEYMALALQEAAKGLYTTSPNPAVGCVIVKDGHIIGSGYHHKAGQPHAEVMAMRSTKQDLAGAECYVTLEPCSHYGRTPPCAKALCEAQVKRVVIAVADPNPKVSGRGIKMMQDAGIEVKVGLLNEQAFALNRAFFKSISTNTPYVVLKYGMSLDGKIALSTGESKWITNEKARSDVQRLRAWSDAMLTSINTVRADNARLNVRYEQLPEDIRSRLNQEQIEQPIKVVLDSHASLTAQELEQYAIFQSGVTYVVHGTHEPIVQQQENAEHQKVIVLNQFKIEKTLKEGVFSVVVPFKKGDDGLFHVSLSDVMGFLNSLQIRVVMVEAGSRLGAAFLTQDLVDECHCYIAPKLLGSNAHSAFNLPEPAKLSEAVHFTEVKSEMLDDNVHISMLNSRIAALGQELCSRCVF